MAEMFVDLSVRDSFFGVAYLDLGKYTVPVAGGRGADAFCRACGDSRRRSSHH